MNCKYFYYRNALEALHNKNVISFNTKEFTHSSTGTISIAVAVLVTVLVAVLVAVTANTN